MAKIVEPLTVQQYQTADGKVPFTEWIDSLADLETRAAIDSRVARLKQGNLGDFKKLKDAEGVIELRIDFGPGFRIYLGRAGNTLVVLLCGGDKRTQNRDIKDAVSYWKDYKERKAADEK